MNDTALYIRCPTCKTVFRTQDRTLELQAAKVRCGQCRMVFNGRSNIVEVAFDEGATAAETSPSPSGEARHESDEIASEIAHDRARELDEHVAAFERARRDHPEGHDSPPSRHAVRSFDDETHRPIAPNPPDDTDPDTTSQSSPATPRTPFPDIGIDRDPLGIEAMPKVAGPDAPTAADTLARYGPTTRSGRTPADPVLRHDAVVMPEWNTPAPPPRRGARWLYSVLSVLLFVGLVAQALFHYRNVIAADYPVTRHYLVAACTTIGCRIEPLRNREEIVIESHDLQADPAHQGLLILQTTLRNQSRHPLAFPHLELELDDNAGKPIVRRVFTPIDYAGGAADFSLGIPANSEWNVKLFLDASSVAAGAYHLYHFYP